MRHLHCARPRDRDGSDTVGTLEKLPPSKGPTGKELDNMKENTEGFLGMQVG